MIRVRARLAVGMACACLLAGAFASAPARADSLPSGWTDDDAPAPSKVHVAPQPERAAPATRPGPAPRVDRARDADRFEDTDPRALTDFQEPLAGHGTWIDDPQYGRVWVPSTDEVGADFAPYQTGGHWTLDGDDEWTWQSDYDWGYVPFHYGRWLWVPGTGWAWIPGRAYAPAWATWRVGDGGYLGWAPLPPDYTWWGGSAVAFRGPPIAAYCFVPTGRVFARNVGAYVMRTPASVRAAAASTRPYHAARPTTAGPSSASPSGTGHSPAHPTSASSRHSPTPEQAHVSASTAARAHAAVDARSAALARPSSTAAFRAHATGRSSGGGEALSHRAWHGGGYGRGAAGRGSYRVYGHGYDGGHAWHGRLGHSGQVSSHGAPALRTPHSSQPSSSTSTAHPSHTPAASGHAGHASGHHR